MLATHDVDLAWALCDELLVLADGRVAAAGAWDFGAEGRLLAANRLREPFLVELWRRLGREPRTAPRSAAAARRGARVKAAIAQYYPGGSALHRLDPRAKFVAVSALAVALFVRDSFPGLAVFAAAAAFGLCPQRRAGALVLARLSAAAVAGGPHLPGAGARSRRARPSSACGSSICRARGLELAAFLSLRLVVLVLVGSVLTLTTPPMALTDGLAWLGGRCAACACPPMSWRSW